MAAGPSVDVGIVNAVDDVDTATSREWAAAAPVSGVAGDRHATEVLRQVDVKSVLGAGQLSRPAPAPLDGKDPAVEEELAAPHTPRLAPLDRALEAGEQGRAGGAQVLGPGDVMQVPAEEDAGEPTAVVVAASVGPPRVITSANVHTPRASVVQVDHFGTLPERTRSALAAVAAGESGHDPENPDEVAVPASQARE